MTAQTKIDFALRSPDIYSPQKVMVRKTADRIVACFDEEGFYFDSLSYGIQPTATQCSPKFLLGLLNSKLVNRIHDEFSQNKDKAFAKVLAENLGRLPFPNLELSIKADKFLHDRLVALVDKMLTLTPALRTAKSDADKATLQNAVKKTDREIDQLVYQLYGLTPEEIALVEGSASPASPAEAN